MNTPFYFPLVACIFSAICSTGFAQDVALEKPSPNTEVAAGTANKPQQLTLSDLAANTSQTGTICGKVYDAKLLSSIEGKPTLLTIGGNANERMEVRISLNDAARFNYNPQKLFLHKNICMTGTVTNKQGIVEMVMDSANTRLLLVEAMNAPVDPGIGKEVRKLKLVSNAYLLAGPGLDEPIVAHLKAATIVVPEYSRGGWSYVKVIEQANTGEQPQWMYGFVRNQALGLKKESALQKELNGIASLLKGKR